MSRAKGSIGARSIGQLRAVVVIIGASALLLAAAWGSWHWQRATATTCGAEPPGDTTVAADLAHRDWERCRDRREADRAVPAALAVFAVMVTASGVVVAYFFRPGHRRLARGELSSS